MARHTTRTLLRSLTVGTHVALDGRAEKLYAAARAFAEADTVFEKIEAQRQLLDASWYLVWTAQQIVRGHFKDGRVPEMPPELVTANAPAKENK